MNETLNWRDLQLFLSVAQASGLAGAVKTTGLSAPTLGRHMTALESATSSQLFVRHKNGYTLTEDGKQLLAYAEKMQHASSDIDRWLEKQDPQPTVKLTAGAWTSRFIAQNLSSLPQDTSYRIVPDNNFFDLRKREAHLAIRNRRPTQQGLAAKKLGTVAFALYGARGTAKFTDLSKPIQQVLETTPCVTFEPNGAVTASSEWLKNRMGRSPAISFSSPLLVLEATLGGAGICILPCFAGDANSELVRCSEAIPELEHVQWLVSHDEDRHLKHVRQTAKALHKLFTTNKSMFSGETPTGP